MNVRPREENEKLLSADFMSRLDQLELVSRKIFAGRMKGERRSKRRGESVEFADYRNYVVGDDLRFLDWNIYGRLERLMLKLFLEEEDLNVTVLFDVSGSMDWGDPHKGLYAKRVAAALAYIALVNHDRLSLYAYGSDVAREMAGVRGRRMTSRVMEFLSNASYGGPTYFSHVARRFALRHRGKGVVVVISDFLDKTGFEEGLRFLLARQLDLYVIQVLAPDEIDPPLKGDLRLVDVEDNERAEVTIDAPLAARYKEMLRSHCAALRDYCTRRGITYLFASTAVPFDTLVLAYLRQKGLVR